MTHPRAKPGARLLLVNPLPRALFHYEKTLLQYLGPGTIVMRPPLEAGASRLGKLKGLFAILAVYVRVSLRTGPVLILWPTFGLLELFFWRWSRGDRYVIIHDPVPLRHQYGFSAFSRALGRWANRAAHVKVVSHTHLARVALEDFGIHVDTVLPHPVAARSHGRPVGEPTLVVAGQAKEARDTNLLREIGDLGPGDLSLRVLGRGWGEIPGWDVDSRFVSEQELDERLASAGAVLVPYKHYFQSGIAARAWELATPIVARRHEFLEELYGEDWPGFVQDDATAADWLAAVQQVLRTAQPVPRTAEEEAKNAWAAIPWSEGLASGPQKG